MSGQPPGDGGTEVHTHVLPPGALAIADPKPADGATVTLDRVPPSPAADALRKSDLARSRMFYVFGLTAPGVAIALSLLIGGDRIAQVVFWIGASVIALGNLVLLILTRRAESYDDSRWVSFLWVTSTIGVQGAVFYWGPFSAVVMVDMLGIVFIALGPLRRTALATTAVCIVGHIGITTPILLGWTDDVGVVGSTLAGRNQLLIAEVLVISIMCSAYALGRWARTTAATAVEELQSAKRIIGDREQALAEVVDEAARQKRVNEGRWTHQKLGEWRLGLVLGRGAMGEVYEAIGPQGQPAAMKLLNARSTASSSIVERFHREMNVAARLESPHIVRVFEISKPDAPVPYIAMERLHGIDLATRLRDESRMPSDELVILLEHVARGLEVARLAGVVHRDLKPHNLFHHDRSCWKILDFGVSKVLDSEGTLTGEGIVGTPQYMAPEQASGGHVTHLADVYALGAIAYRCLTGRSLFKGNDVAELVYQVVHVPPARPSTLVRVSAPLEDVLAIAMAKDATRRFPSALAFAEAFVAARRGHKPTIDVPERAWA